jgi:transcriptional regulator with XRE-family HTH domain
MGKNRAKQSYAASRVQAFMQHAYRKAGRREKLVEAIAEDINRRYGATMVSHWTGGSEIPSADVVFAISRALDIPLDSFVVEQPEQKRYAVSFEAHLARLDRLWEAEQERREAEGQEPLAEPGMDRLAAGEDST